MTSSAWRAAAQSVVGCDRNDSTCSAHSVGFTPRFTRIMHSLRGVRCTPISSRHNGDTVDLLEGGVTPPDHIERRLAQQAYTGLLSQLLQLPHRRAVDDGFAHFVVEHE